MFVCLCVCVSVCDKDAVTICTLGIGTAFGESILDNTPRHATIVSRETSELLRIEQREFKNLWEVRETESESQCLRSASFFEDTAVVTSLAFRGLSTPS